MTIRGSFHLEGNLTNAGVLRIEGTLVVANSGRLGNEKGIDNIGILINRGTLKNQGSATLINTGTLRNQGSATLTNKGTATLRNRGTLNNYGSAQLTNEGSATIDNHGSATLNNKGSATLNNDGTATLSNTGTISNKGSATLNNKGSAILDNHSNANLNNLSTMTNEGSATIDNHGSASLRNGANATLTNKGTIFNRNSAILNNKGDFNNLHKLNNSATFEYCGVYRPGPLDKWLSPPQYCSEPIPGPFFYLGLGMPTPIFPPASPIGLIQGEKYYAWKFTNNIKTGYYMVEFHSELNRCLVGACGRILLGDQFPAHSALWMIEESFDGNVLYVRCHNPPQDASGNYHLNAPAAADVNTDIEIVYNDQDDFMKIWDINDISSAHHYYTPEKISLLHLKGSWIAENSDVIYINENSTIYTPLDQRTYNIARPGSSEVPIWLSLTSNIRRLDIESQWDWCETDAGNFYVSDKFVFPQFSLIYHPEMDRLKIEKIVQGGQVAWTRIFHRD